MFLGDCHTHSICSPDGSEPMTAMVRSAHAAGLKHLCITDHCDLLDLNGTPTPEYDWGPYRAAFSQAQTHLPPGLSLGRGLELGSAHENPAAARAVLAGEPELDFVLGSAHNFRTMMGKQDFYNADYSDRDLCLAALEDYLGSLLALTALPDCYDSLAHILYPLRYMRRAGQDVSLDDGGLPQLLRQVLLAVAQTGKAMEVNTWRGRTVAQWEPLLRLFKSLGGEYVTVGSDAHVTADLGKGVREAYRLMKTCGFDYVAVYKARKPEMERI